MGTRTNRSVGVIAATVAALSLGAIAQSAAAQAAPVRMIDESELYVRLWTPSPETGYVMRVDATVYGVTSGQDAIRLDVKQRGRAVASVRCPIDVDRGETVGRIRCATSDEQPLTTTGDLDVDLVYVDDVAESTETIRTMHLRVNAYPYWVRSDGSRLIMGSQWQIDGSDMLGTAFAYRQRPTLQQTDAMEPQVLAFYAAFSGRFSSRNAVLRCTVGGTRIPDRMVHMDPFGDFDVEERLSQDSEIRRLGWYRARIEMQDLWWGTRISIPSSGTGYNTSETAFLGDHPGLWSCDLRSEGNVLRTFRFNVDVQGMLVPHAEQSGPDGMRLIHGLTLIDVRLPAANTIDAIVDPAAIRRSSQLGRPWSSPEAVREMLGALPSALGSAAPSSVRGGARGGRARR